MDDERCAIILGGGAGRRLGGVAKAAIRLGGNRLVDTICGDLEDRGVGRGRQVFVAGAHVEAPRGVRRTLEDPPDGGPLAGIAAGVAALGLHAGASPESLVGVVSVDAPLGGAIVGDLFGACPPGGAVLARSRDGHRHHLLAVYSATGLVSALETLSRRWPGTDEGRYANVRDRAARHLVEALASPPVYVDVDAEAMDIDTPVDLAVWGASIN
ncbi:MAG: NTP transferase domain-containing protein [Actinomycetaceae bacterium]|nr:NTP transferase domain-containing protein [Actinomycetaceae bacterium]